MRYRFFVTGKIHRATVTDANVNYKGSITLDPRLIAAAGFQKFEMVHVNNVNNGNHWETYIIPGKEGDVILNGPPAHLFSKGDLVVINRIEQISTNDLATVKQTVVFVNETNTIEKVEIGEL